MPKKVSKQTSNTSMNPPQWDLSESKEQELLNKFKEGFNTQYMKDLRGVEIQSMLDKYPPWNFYTYKESATPGAIRILGIDEVEQENGAPSKYCLRIFKAEDGNIKEFNRVPADNIIAIDKWTPGHIEIIMKCGNPDVFLRHIGFSYILKLKDDIRTRNDNSQSSDKHELIDESQSFMN